MIIDFHTHISPDKIASAAISELETNSGLKAATNGCIDGLLHSMETADVGTSVVMPVVTSPKQFDGINRFAYSINEGIDVGNEMPKLISFGGRHPECDDYKGKLRFLKEMGFRGIKLHPDYQETFFNDISYKRIVSYATELGLLIMVHAGIDIGLPEPVHCTPDMSYEVIRETESENVILAHMGGWKQWEQVENLLAGANVYLDMAFIHEYISEEQFLRIVSMHGSDKILFATDSPWAKQNEAAMWLKNSLLTFDEKDNIFELNARRLLTH